jgi:hypothetical protein
MTLQKTILQNDTTEKHSAKIHYRKTLLDETEHNNISEKHNVPLQNDTL